MMIRNGIKMLGLTKAAIPDIAHAVYAMLIAEGIVKVYDMWREKRAKKHRPSVIVVEPGSRKTGTE